MRVSAICVLIVVLLSALIETEGRRMSMSAKLSRRRALDALTKCATKQADPVPDSSPLLQAAEVGGTKIDKCGESDDACIKKNVEVIVNYQKANVHADFKKLIEEFVAAETKVGVKSTDIMVRSEIPDVKSVESGARKVKSDYKGDARRLIDVVRGSVIYRNEADLAAGVCRLRKFLDDHGLKRSQEKDNFSKVDPTGYVDYKFNIGFTKDPKHLGAITELQIHQCSVLDAKQSKSIPRNGHAIYEELRVLKKGADDAKIATLTAEAKKLYDAARTPDAQAKCDMGKVSFFFF